MYRHTFIVYLLSCWILIRHHNQVHHLESQCNIRAGASQVTATSLQIMAYMINPFHGYLVLLGLAFIDFSVKTRVDPFSVPYSYRSFCFGKHPYFPTVFKQLFRKLSLTQIIFH